MNSEVRAEIQRRIDALLVEVMTGPRSVEPESVLRVDKHGAFHSCDKHCPCQNPPVRGGWLGSIINLDGVT